MRAYPFSKERGGGAIVPPEKEGTKE